MSNNHGAAWNRDALRQTFAAELTFVAYRVALRHRTDSTWVDLELDLWRALTETVKSWELLPRAEAAFACDWAAGQPEGTLGDPRDGLGHWPDARPSLSGD